MKREPRDLVVTWPKTLLLDVYLTQCALAARRGDVINYRIAQVPAVDFGEWKDRMPRVYVVHDGAVRGHQDLKHIAWRNAYEVFDTHTGQWWAAGWYLVRDPEWHAIEPIPMRGFQGWRWFSEDEARAVLS